MACDADDGAFPADPPVRLLLMAAPVVTPPLLEDGERSRRLSENEVNRIRDIPYRGGRRVNALYRGNETSQENPGNDLIASRGGEPLARRWRGDRGLAHRVPEPRRGDRM